jgi:hypothetical protein
MPEAFTYSLKIPTLKGVVARVKRAFAKEIDSLIAEELAFYTKGALSKDQLDTRMSQDADASIRGRAVRDVPEWYLEWCHEGFTDLTAEFTSSLYRGRYASVVITFSGYNAPCYGTGGLWEGYQSDRSITIDTRTGEFKSLSDFTSNAEGKVTAAVKAWYSKQSHELFEKRPTMTKKPTVCDRPGNVITISPAQSHCYSRPSERTGPVAWLVQDKGLRLTFPAGEGPRYATLKWSRIPQLL